MPSQGNISFNVRFLPLAMQEVKNAPAVLLNLLLRHLARNKNDRFIFIDFFFFVCSSARSSLSLIWMFSTVCLITDFLTSRSQKKPCSESTELPQGCMVSLLLFILYTNEWLINHESRLEMNQDLFLGMLLTV